MKITAMSFILSYIILFGVFSTGHFTFAQESSDTLISIKMDKSSYTIGDTLTLLGQLNTSDEGKPITLQLFDPKNHMYQTSTNVSEDGSFTYSITAVGALWKPSGTYTVKAIGPNNISAQTTFQFIGEQLQTPSPTSPSTPSPVPTPTPPTQIPTPPSSEPTAKIPNWVKSLFSMYSKGQVSDDELVNVLKFLVQIGIIRLS